MGKWVGHKKMPGTYKVKGISPRYWWDDDPDCDTRRLLKEDTQRELDEYYAEGEVKSVPGAFGDGPPTPRREKREDPGTRQLRFWFRLRSKYPDVDWSRLGPR